MGFKSAFKGLKIPHDAVTEMINRQLQKLKLSHQDLEA
jgi:hypothetical protein